MSTITTADGTQIFYKDWGTGQLVVMVPTKLLLTVVCGAGAGAVRV